MEPGGDGAPRLRDPSVLADMIPAPGPDRLPAVARHPEETAWLNRNALVPFVEEVRSERLAAVGRVSEHVEFSLTGILQRLDEEIGRAADEVANEVTGAEGRLAQAARRQAEVPRWRERRREELMRRRAVSLQGAERLASVLVLPHPEGETLAVRRLRPHSETEMPAMRVAMDYETARGRKVHDVHEQNLGYNVTSLDLQSSELRLIEVKGLAAPRGSILLTPNGRRVAEDRPDCYRRYVVTNCANAPELRKPIRDPARFPWHEVTGVQHYWMDVKAMTGPMQPGAGRTTLDIEPET